MTVHDKPNPCKGCGRRTMICHIHCQAYETWQKEHRAFLAVQDVQGRLNSANAETHLRIVKEMRRRSRR